MLPEVLQVLRGAGKVGSALVTTQGEHLCLITSNSTIGAGLKLAQEMVNGLMSTFMASSNLVFLPLPVELLQEQAGLDRVLAFSTGSTGSPIRAGLSMTQWLPD
ncbi:unnamed protein product [Tetraodon nigroviridis]|uniref:(spotted green pufferfish) hypothetical protein n=1 Tax=Tetraodon nigroviridis TaxID=99883 RepID=Q4RYU4_TETNG|nr:unnamed protein product [Tetraodon nigroviridis]